MPALSLWLGLATLCFVLQWLDLVALLRYDRHLVEAGQWYRLITANLVHLNATHLLLNLTGLLLVVVFFSSHLKVRQWLVLILLDSLAVTLGIYLFNPELLRYVGFSGVVHGLFIAGAVVEIRRFPLSGWLLMIVLVSKLGWEQVNGPMPGSESMVHGRVVVDAHLYGSIVGLVYMLWIERRSILKRVNQ